MEMVKNKENVNICAPEPRCFYSEIHYTIGRAACVFKNPLGIMQKKNIRLGTKLRIVLSSSSHDTVICYTVAKA